MDCQVCETRTGTIQIKLDGNWTTFCFDCYSIFAELQSIKKALRGE